MLHYLHLETFFFQGMDVDEQTFWSNVFLQNNKTKYHNWAKLIFLLEI
jgi:hypothetical protein